MAQADKAREDRIADEIVVDCYNEEERASGWYCRLESALKFPFQAECIAERRGTPLRNGEKVSVVAMADQDYCSREMFVEVEWREARLAVPLAQLKPLNAPADTVQAIGDWHYWMAKGYEF